MKKIPSLALRAVSSLLSASLVLSLPLSASSADGSAEPVRVVDPVLYASPLVITATRWPEPAENIARSVSMVERQDIERNLSKGFTDAIRLEPGVSISQAAPGRAEPNIRGLGSSSRLLMMDGIRLNDAAAGTIHAMSIESIERIEVLRGPASVLYGGDAIGGVVHMISRRREDYSKPSDIGGRLSGTVSTADHGRQGLLELQGNRGNFGFLTGLSVQQFSDLSAGGDIGRLYGTSYKTTGIDTALDWRLKKATLRATYQHMTDGDVPKYKDLISSRRYVSAGTYDEYTFDPDRRDMLVLEAQADKLEGPVESVESKVFWHHKELGSRLHKAAGTAAKTEEVHGNIINTYGGRVQATSRPFSLLKVVYGLDAHTDQVRSWRDDITLKTGSSADNSANSDYPDGSNYNSAGAFVFGQWVPDPRWIVDLGGRYNYSWLDSVIRMTSVPGTGFAFRDRNHALTGGASVLWKAFDRLHFTGSVMQGFRSPDLSDTVVLKSGGTSFQAPSMGLKPEKSLQFEVGVRHSLGRFRHSVTAYHTLLTDLIDKVPGSWNGSTTYSGKPVYVNSNINAAYIQGAEWEGWLDLVRGLSLFGNASYTFGRDKCAGTALSKIPPAMVVAGARWESTQGLKKYLDVYTRMAGRQKRLSPNDLTDGSIDPAGTASWATVNLRAGWAPKRWVSLSVVAENLFDRPYREHGSSVDAPGVNVSSRLEFFF